MAKLPENTLESLSETTLAKIEAIEYGGDEIPRGYLGMSGIGHPCVRALWAGFHWVSGSQNIHSARTDRIFNTGHLAEEFVINDLKKVGVEVFKREPETHDGPKYCDKIPLTGEVGEKQETIVGFAGHAKGHPDGRCLGVIEAPKTEHLLEIKTANDSNWKSIAKHGVRKSKFLHYAQCQKYMGKLGLTRALYCCYNKNTSQYYFERIYFDKSFFEDLERKEQSVIISDKPPERMDGASPRWMDCKFCNQKGWCFSDEEPAMSCRTCDSCDLEMEGIWRCKVSGKVLSIEDQMRGCEFYKKGWDL